MTPYDPSELRCTNCHMDTIFMDYKAGDAVCTSCGLVNKEHLHYEGAEWRDYSAVNDDRGERRNIARAGSVVNESRWVGGLEPTSLGSVYGNYSADGERYRKTLDKVKKVVDSYFDHQSEQKIKDGRNAMINRKRRLGETGPSSHKNDKHEDDENIEIAKQRMNEGVLLSDKWSLERALFLHGKEHEIPERFLAAAGSIELERNAQIRRMDMSQRKASESIYRIYNLVKKILVKLNLSANVGVETELIEAICRFASAKGSLTVKGCSSQISTKKSHATIEKQRNFNKLRQMGALVASFLFLLCKKNGIGRTLAEICESFDDLNESGATDEKLIKAKHCSKAIGEIKDLMPDYYSSIRIIPQQNGSTTSVKPDPVSSSSTNIQTQSNTFELTMDMVQHSLKNLKLPSAAVTAVGYLVAHVQQNMDGYKKPNIVIAAVAFLVCDAGAIMQKLASQVKDKDSSKKSAQGHVRPRVASAVIKRRKLDVKESVPSKVSSSDPVSRVTPEPVESFDALKQPVSSTDMSAATPKVSSWTEWRHQQPWKRNIDLIINICKASPASTKEFYKKEIFPKRKGLLHHLQAFTPSQSLKDGTQVSILFSNISAAAPLMKSDLK